MRWLLYCITAYCAIVFVACNSNKSVEISKEVQEDYDAIFVSEGFSVIPTLSYKGFRVSKHPSGLLVFTKKLQLQYELQVMPDDVDTVISGTKKYATNLLVLCQEVPQNSQLHESGIMKTLWQKDPMQLVVDSTSNLKIVNAESVIRWGHFQNKNLGGSYAALEVVNLVSGRKAVFTVLMTDRTGLLQEDFEKFVNTLKEVSLFE